MNKLLKIIKLFFSKTVTKVTAQQQFTLSRKPTRSTFFSWLISNSNCILYVDASIFVWRLFLLYSFSLIIYNVFGLLCKYSWQIIYVQSMVCTPVFTEYIAFVWLTFFVLDGWWSWSKIGRVCAYQIINWMEKYINR